MTHFYPLFTMLGLTVAILAAVLVTGFRARRRLHIPLVVCFFISLLFTVLEAEKLGEGLDLEQAGIITPVHLWFAKITTLGYLLPVISGIMTLRRPAWKSRHRSAVFLLLVLTVVTLVTGLWMGLAAGPA